MGEGGWGRLHKQVALLLQVRCAESSSEGFLTVPEEPESTSFFPPLVHSNLSLVFVHTGMGRKKKGRMCSNRQCPASGDKELNGCSRLSETRMIFTSELNIIAPIHTAGHQTHHTAALIAAISVHIMRRICAQDPNHRDSILNTKMQSKQA